MYERNLNIMNGERGTSEERPLRRAHEEYFEL
jgi:hypothetical protein